MTSRPQQRDSQGCFTWNVQPQPIEVQPQQMLQLQAGASQLSQYQHTFIAASAPITSSLVPVAKTIARAAAIFQQSASESDSDPPPPTCYIPPPRYATEPPLAAPDFNVPGSDDSLLRTLSSYQLENTLINTAQQPNSGNHKQLPQYPQHPQTLPQPAQQLLHQRLLPPLLPHAQQITNTMVHAPAYSISAMPSIHSKLAPYFSGKISQLIKEFLEEYNELADKHGLTNRQKVDTVIWYVNKQQHHIWRSLDGFLNRDWNQLCTELRNEYVSPTTAGKHTKKMLLKLVEDSAQSCMEYETDMIDYHRQFNTISKPLIDNGKITTSERNILFWRGFHPEDRRALHEHLIAKQSDNPRGQAFDLTLDCMSHLLR